LVANCKIVIYCIMGKSSCLSSMNGPFSIANSYINKLRSMGKFPQPILSHVCSSKVPQFQYTGYIINKWCFLFGFHHTIIIFYYHLVMTDIAIENHHAIKNGKPSISMGHLYHGKR
jgi:hypothetical protein